MSCPVDAKCPSCGEWGSNWIPINTESYEIEYDYDGTKMGVLRFGPTWQCGCGARFRWNPRSARLELRGGK